MRRLGRRSSCICVGLGGFVSQFLDEAERVSYKLIECIGASERDHGVRTGFAPDLLNSHAERREMASHDRRRG